MQDAIVGVDYDAEKNIACYRTQAVVVIDMNVDFLPVSYVRSGAAKRAVLPVQVAANVAFLTKKTLHT
jgi:hypothetical protein